MALSLAFAIRDYPARRLQALGSFFRQFYCLVVSFFAPPSGSMQGVAMWMHYLILTPNIKVVTLTKINGELENLV